MPEEYWVGSIQPGFFYRGDRGEREPVLYGRIDGEDVRAYLMETVYWDEEPESAGGEVVRRVGLRFFVGNLDDWEGFEASRGPHWRNVQAAARESCLPPE